MLADDSSMPPRQAQVDERDTAAARGSSRALVVTCGNARYLTYNCAFGVNMSHVKVLHTVQGPASLPTCTVPRRSKYMKPHYNTGAVCRNPSQLGSALYCRDEAVGVLPTEAVPQTRNVRSCSPPHQPPQH